MNKLKTWLSGFANGVTVCLAIAFCMWIHGEYQGQQTGYTKETRLRMDELVRNVAPLKLSDLDILDNE